MSFKSFLIWGFVEGWRILTAVWHLDLDLVMVIGLEYTHDLNFDCLY